MSEATEALKNFKDNKEPEVPAPAPAPKHGPKAEYQQYTSARVSTCLITTAGKRVNFTNYEYYTKDPEIIEFLDYEISGGMKGITKGRLVLAEDINPMAALKRKHIEEFLASQEGRSFGDNTEGKVKINALTTDQVIAS